MAQDNRIIKLLKQPDVTDLAGEKVMIDFDSGKYFMLKGAANDIWDFLKDGVTVEDIIQGLLTMYTVEEAECRQTTVQFLEHIRDLGFVSLEG